MNELIHILHLEDSVLDAELIHARLQRGGLNFLLERVDTRESFHRALHSGRFGLILADYALPTFDGISALEMTREEFPDLPFIFVSGVLGEEVAIDTLKRGATDYVVKQRSERLVPTIIRAMAEADTRRQRRLAEAAQREAHAAAEAANLAKDRFLAILSHELRTPLTPVLATVNLLEMDDSLPAQVREHLDVIRRNVELEARLIDDLLDITRIARGKIQLDLRSVDLHEVVRNVIDICRADALQRRQRIDANLQAIHITVNADPARLHQILWNLVKNAIKFTPDEGVIQISSRNQGAFAIIEVEDNGIGIPAESLTRIFTAFEQAAGDSGRPSGGLGLGLAIAQALARAHGGLLTARSSGVGRGACFTLAIPTTLVPVAPAPMTEPPQAADVPGLHVLLVEDHVDTARAMKRLLGMMGHEVELAHTVHDARQKLSEFTFDLLISDVGLPDGSGIDLVASQPANQRVPAIALTGFGMEKDIERCLAAGFDRHLAKPISRSALQAAIVALT